MSKLADKVLEAQFSICVLFLNIKLSMCSNAYLQSGFHSFIFLKCCSMRKSPVSLVLICCNLLVNLNNSLLSLYVCVPMFSSVILTSSSCANFSSNLRHSWALEMETGFSIPHKLTSPSLTPFNPWVINILSKDKLNSFPCVLDKSSQMSSADSIIPGSIFFE